MFNVFVKSMQHIDFVNNNVLMSLSLGVNIRNKQECSKVHGDMNLVIS